MRATTLLCAVAIAAVSGMLAGGASAATGRLDLYLVNAGPLTTVYNDSSAVDGDCDSFTTPGSLSTSKGSSVRGDSPGYAFGSAPHPSTFSYTVPSGGGFTVRPNANALVLKMWSYSGDGSCDGQTADQTIDWRVTCTGSCGTGVSLSGPGQLGDKLGWEAFGIPAGTPTHTLFNIHSGPAGAVTVRAGDVITLALSADTWAGFAWSAPAGAGVSSLAILRS